MSKITITHQDGIANVLLDGQEIGGCVEKMEVEIDNRGFPVVRMALCPLAADLDLAEVAAQLQPLRLLNDEPMPEAMERLLLAHLLKKYPFARSDHWARNGAPLDAGVDMATGPDKTAMATLGCGEWNPRLPLAPLFPRNLQRLEVKDTITGDGSGRALPELAAGGVYSGGVRMVGDQGPELKPGAPYPGEPAAEGAMRAWAHSVADMLGPERLAAVRNAVSQESTDPDLPISMVEPEDTNPVTIQALPANANLMKVR